MSGALFLLPINDSVEWKRTVFFVLPLPEGLTLNILYFPPHYVCVILTTNSVPSGSIFSLFLPMEARCVVSEV